MSELIGRDSTNPFAIPLEDLAVVMGYGDGIYEWTSAGWARFEAPIVALSIVVLPGDVGDIADVERFDFSPSDAPGFVQSFNRSGRRAATLYVSRGNWPQVVAALQLAGLDPGTVDWWVATLDGTLDLWFGDPSTSVPAGLRVVAVQARGSAQTGGDYDESVILDPTWIQPAAPLPNPVPPMEASSMILFNVAPGSDPYPGIWALDGGRYWHVLEDATRAGLVDPSQPSPVRVVTISLAEHQNIQAVYAAAPAGSGLTAAQAQQLTETHDATLRVEKGLQSA